MKSEIILQYYKSPIPAYTIRETFATKYFNLVYISICLSCVDRQQQVWIR